MTLVYLSAINTRLSTTLNKAKEGSYSVELDSNLRGVIVHISGLSAHKRLYRLLNAIFKSKKFFISVLLCCGYSQVQ